MFKRKLTAAAVASRFPARRSPRKRNCENPRGNTADEGNLREAHRGLEKRVKEAEAKAGKADANGAASRPSGRDGKRVQPGDLAHPAGHRAEHLAGSQHLPDHGLRALGRRSRPAEPRLRPRGNRAPFSGNIDPYFRGVAIAALTPENEVEVEEAYFQTLALPRGFTLRAGASSPASATRTRSTSTPGTSRTRRCRTRRSSAAGCDDGVQLRWVAPTPIFLELGAEVSGGDQFPGTDRNKNGRRRDDVRPRRRRHRREHAWRAGLSYLRARRRTAPSRTSIRSAPR